LIPVYKIQTYDRLTSALEYTITSDPARIRLKDVLTDDVGTFEFTLPTKNATTYQYTGIDVGDTVRIWLDYDSIAAGDVEQAYGKITNITSAPTPQGGYTRTYTGKTRGYVMEQQINKRDAYVGTTAHNIVDAIGTALGLNLGDVAADGTTVTITFDHELYVEQLRKISDYWFDVANQVRKDFYVNVANNLVWKTRPFQVSSESLVLGDNNMSYSLAVDGNNVKNSIIVYGRKNSFTPSDLTIQGKKYPTDGDSWTWGDGWTGLGGTSVGTWAVAPHVGVSCTRGTNAAAGIEYYRTFNQTWVDGLDGYGSIEYWGRRGLLAGDTTVRLYCPDSSHYYQATISEPSPADTWEFRSIAIGNNNVYSATGNQNGQWTSINSPSWDNIQGIYFGTAGGGGFYFDVDGLCFNYARWNSGVVEDATVGGSQAKYGVRQLVVVDDEINSDADCIRRANSILRQKKDEVRRLDVTTTGNTKFLLGDQISMTLPAEGISAVPFYVMSIEHQFSKQPDGWTTGLSMLDTVNTRIPPPVTLPEIIRQKVNRIANQGGANGRWSRGG